MTWIENFLITRFGDMPLWVRVVVYFFILFLFAYLLLSPRFINGELVYRTDTGGSIPYRGADIKTHIEGRVLKFKSNEDGVWSIPLVSRLPKTLHVEIFNEDEGAWFGIDFEARNIWAGTMFTIEISANEPFVTLAVSHDTFPSKVLAAVHALIPSPTSTAFAGRLEILPPELPSGGEFGGAALGEDPEELEGTSRAVETTVMQTIASVTGQDAAQLADNAPFSGPDGPRYVERIRIVSKLEQEYRFKIPDEHWRYLTTVGELVEYIRDRKIQRQYDELVPQRKSKRPRFYR